MSERFALKSKWWVRAGLAICVAIYLAYSMYGIAAPFWWGHHGYHGATYMLRARTSLRQHMVTPATWSGWDPPPPAAKYFHHPIGYHHLLTLLIPIVGDKEWVARGLAVAGGLVALLALYVMARRAWSRELGLVAVAVYVCLPVLTSFSILSDPMLLAFGCVCWALWAYYDLLERPSRRALIHAAAAYALGGLIMWESYFIAPFIAVHALAHRFTARGRTLKLGRFNALDLHTFVTGAACVAMMAFHLWFTHHAGVWQDFLDSYRLRHAAPSPGWVVERHTQWVEILFGTPPLVVGAAWFALWLARLATGRGRRRDLLVLTFLYVNTIYIYLFAEGSSVHLYRVFFYSGFFTLAMTDLCADAGAWLGPIAAACALAGYLACEIPHAWANLIESRVVMGTHGHVGYNPEAEKMRFAQEVHRRTDQPSRVIIDYAQLGSRKEFWYYIDRSFDEITHLAQAKNFEKTWPKSVLIFDHAQLREDERVVFRELVAKHPVSFYRSFAMIDLRSDKPGEQSFDWKAQPMTAGYRFWVSSKYPRLEPVRAPYLPGICDVIAAGAPVAPPSEEPTAARPQDARMLPCHHNYLLLRGDLQGAAALARELQHGGTSLGATSGVIAATVERNQLAVVLKAGGPEKGELRYAIKQPGRPESFVPHGSSLAAPSSWKAGWLYGDSVSVPVGPIEVSVQLTEPAKPPPAPPAWPRWNDAFLLFKPPAPPPKTPPTPPPTILSTAVLGHYGPPNPPPSPPKPPAPPPGKAPAPAPAKPTPAPSPKSPARPMHR